MKLSGGQLLRVFVLNNVNVFIIRIKALLTLLWLFVIMLWIFNGLVSLIPRGWNPFEHERGNADIEFQNNTILSRYLGGPNKISYNINAHRSIYYFEVLSENHLNKLFICIILTVIIIYFGLFNNLDVFIYW